MKCEIKYVQPGSILFSSVPVLLFLVGLVAGLATFVFFPNATTAPMAFPDKMMAVGVFSLIYMVAFLALFTVCAIVYNLLTAGLGLNGIKVQLDELPEPGVDEEDA